jgi:hypothetical protein
MTPDMEIHSLDSPEYAPDQAPKNGPSAVPTTNDSSSISFVRTGGGPKTKQGKERARLNALRHGLFSKLALLESESRADFNALYNGLREDREPVGALEEILVSRLAIDFWRLRRLPIAEAAEIQAAKEFLQWDERERDRQDASRLLQLSCNGGLIPWIANPEALRASLDLLQNLKNRIEEHGFDSEYNEAILTKLYGGYGDESVENWKRTLSDSYLVWRTTSLCSDEERQQKGYELPQTCKEKFLGEVKEEIQRLERYEKEHASVSARKLELESLRRSVPEGPELDRLLRYNVTLSREVERTLNQLERCQRMRRGQPVPPPINLNVNSL